jgi:hypothetical protein
MAANNSKDVLCNLFGIEGQTHETNATTLYEEQIGTGVSLMGEKAWLIHQIEWYWEKAALGESHALEAALSFRKGLTTMPGMASVGTISKYKHLVYIAGASGMACIDQPHVVPFPVPFPFIKPNISLYVQCDADSANLRGKEVAVRIHFTTVKLDDDIYKEVLEGWGFQE